MIFVIGLFCWVNGYAVLWAMQRGGFLLTPKRERTWHKHYMPVLAALLVCLGGLIAMLVSVAIFLWRHLP